MDTNRLRTGELIAGISGAVLILVMFLSWWGSGEVGEAIEQAQEIAEQFGATGVEEADTSYNAWELADFMDIIWFLTGAVAIALAVATATARTVSLPVAASAITAGLGILSTLLILYRLIDPPFDASRKFGVFVGLLAAAGIAYGGWRSMQEEGTTFGGEADRLQDRAGGSESQAPPPAAPPPARETPPPPPPREGPPPSGPTV